MSDAPPPRLLFVPVSGAFGRGEYARSLAIAQAAALRWPDAAIHFVLSRAAPYAADAPFATTLLPSSATFHSAAVLELIGSWRPHVVVFDNAGRSAQVRAAHRSGARVVYISARPKQRRKAFRLRWMRCLDEHWIAYPALIAGAPGLLERGKLRLLGRPRLRYLDVILAGRHADAARRQDVLARRGAPARYALVVPGGGTGHPGARQAVETFRAAAALMAAAGIDTLIVGAADWQPDTPVPSLTRLPDLPQSELAVLMRGARLVLANGGSTLVQAIACGRPCIAAPIADDQPERIRRCAAAGVTIAVGLERRELAQQAIALWGDAARLEALTARAAALELADGLAVAVDALAGLIQRN